MLEGSLDKLSWFSSELSRIFTFVFIALYFALISLTSVHKHVREVSEPPDALALRLTLASFADMLLIVDAEQRIIFCNSAFLEGNGSPARRGFLEKLIQVADTRPPFQLLL